MERVCARPKLMVSSVLAAVMAIAPHAWADPTFRKGPFLSHLDSHGVNVRAELSAPSAASLVVEADGKAARTVTEPDARSFHDLRVTGLDPATHYRYVMRAGTTAARGELTTAPPDDSQAPFAFLIYGDNRTDTAAHAAVVRSIRETPSDFLLNTGDFVQEGGLPAEWQDFFGVEGS